MMLCHSRSTAFAILVVVVMMVRYGESFAVPCGCRHGSSTGSSSFWFRSSSRRRQRRAPQAGGERIATTSTTSTSLSPSSTYSTTTTTVRLQGSCYQDNDGFNNTRQEKGTIEVSHEIDLPVPASVAFAAFSDLSRQPIFSPWLRKVEYLHGATENNVGTTTRWTMSYLGLRFSWNALSTRQDRDLGIIEWKSITGLRNNGRVTFANVDEERSLMRMSMTFATPRLAARLLGNDTHKVKNLIENRMLKSTLTNFREIVTETDWKGVQQQQQQQQQQQRMTEEVPNAEGYQDAPPIATTATSSTSQVESTSGPVVPQQ